jgi:hypothetical protein
VEHERVPESIDLILSDADYEYPIILEPGWELLRFLETMGADEFTLRFLFEGGDPKKGAVPVFVREPGSVAQAHSVGRAHSDALFARLEEYYLGERERETGTGIGHVVGYELQISREIGTWRFDEESRRALRDVLPDGIMDGAVGNVAWCEDLCVYRGGELLLCTISHEHEAFLRLHRQEVAQFEAWALREEERITGAPLNESLE